MLLPFSLILGLIAYAALRAEPSFYNYMISSLIVTGLLLGSVAIASLPAMRFAIQLAAIWLGFCLLPIHGYAFGTAMLRAPAYGTYEMRIDEVLSVDDGGARVVVSALTPQDGDRSLPIRRARVLLPVEPAVEIGDQIEARIRLAPVPGPVLPGAFDSQFHAYFAGIGAYGNAIGPVTLVAQGDEGDLARRVQALRNNIAARIDLALIGESAAIGKAMMMGDQSAITDETRDVMAASGLAHVYSISGLHLSIVAGGIFWLVRLLLACFPIALIWPVKHVAAIAGLSAAFGYLLLAGGMDNVPAFRSTLMLGLIFGAVLAGRQALTMRNVAVAALVIIVIDPASVFRASFQLSFAAVVALIGIYELPRTSPKGGGSVGRAVRFVSATAWTSFVAGAATLLFSAYHFQQTAPLGVLGNVLALPFVSLIMWFGVLAILAMPFGLDDLFLKFMGWNIDRMVDVADLVAGWSAGISGNPILASWTLVAALVALGWFAFAEGKWRLLAPAVLVPVVLVFGFAPRPDVLVADTTQAVAVRDGEGLALISGRTGSFAVDVWSRHYQTEIAAKHSSSRCDSLGCIVETPDFSIAVVRNAAAFPEDCFGQNLVITRVDAPKGCGADGQFIGPRDLAAGGVHWLRWDEMAGRFEIRPAIETLNRPWRVVPR
ncbi:ComEC/Rec2 family competence protein [Devosia sp.]|uniref:ComEC/Rec2 family competence protein n=1 Tax=Devosia sp. TaxID=1871048 RepID=UPI001AD34090|nr:ComEC/Rec2 family competence protein [Devosia sp.]MBN9334578.1 ComEC/Rec2 family competence protein [Devosia sp.]